MPREEAISRLVNVSVFRSPSSDYLCSCVREFWGLRFEINDIFNERRLRWECTKKDPSTFAAAREVAEALKGHKSAFCKFSGSDVLRVDPCKDGGITLEEGEMHTEYNDFIDFEPEDVQSCLVSDIAEWLLDCLIEQAPTAKEPKLQFIKKG